MEGTDDSFILKFEYKEKPHILEVHPLVQQYRISFKVMVEENEITFEKDEEGQFRAISNVQAHNGHTVDPELLQEIARRIHDAIYGE